MNNLLKEILIHLGGTVSIIIACLIFFKNILNKYIDTIIESSAQKSIEKLKNQFSKTLSAYELLLKKEFEYYESIDCILADLIVDIQDFKSNTINEFDFDIEKRLDIVSNASLRILKSIISIKRNSLLYQSYIPRSIMHNSTLVVVKLQENANLISNSFKLLQDLKEDEINMEQIKSFSEDILLLIANLETSISIRLRELANTSKEEIL